MMYSLWQEFWLEVAALASRPLIAKVFPIFWKIAASNGRELFTPERND